MPAPVKMESSQPTKNGLQEPTSLSSKAAEGLDDSKSGSDLSDVEMEDLMSKAEAEHNLVEDVIVKEEDDNSLVVFHCWLCSVEFIDKISIVRHLKEWHKDRPEVHNLDRLMKVPLCMECGVQGPCEHQDGERHEEDEGGTAYMCRPRFLTCRSCPEQFLSAEAVRLHRAKEHPDEPSHQCSYCTEAFFDHPSLVTHSRIHLGGRPYICTTCGNRFSKISDLKRHERIHSGEKPFKCMQCHQTFTQKSSLEKHAKIHAKRSGHLACLLCGLLFEEKDALMEHAQEMHKGNNFICGICGKMYTEERYLILHEKTHESNKEVLKPFACSFCDRRFTLKHLLEKHEKKMHLHKREIKCHLCNKTFKRNENLTRHMLSHSGVKNFQCSECGVGFTEKGSLTRHFKAQHQQLKPHTCPICRRAFTRKSLVRKHVERFHVQKARELVSQRNKFFRCRLCLKLLRKSGKRQHERHHRSKGDVWDGSLEEKINGENDGDIQDLDSLLGPEVARLLREGKRGSRGSGDDGGDDDEDDNEEDEGADDNNEDENEDEELDEEDENDEGDDKNSSFDGDADKSFEGEDIEEQTEKGWPKSSQISSGPVFPEFKHLEAEEPRLNTPDVKDDSAVLQSPNDDETLNSSNPGPVESPPDNSWQHEAPSARIEPDQYEQSTNLEPRRSVQEPQPKKSHKYHTEKLVYGVDGRKNITPRAPKPEYHDSNMTAEFARPETSMQPQQEYMNERISSHTSYPSRYPAGKEELPQIGQDLRAQQQGFRDIRENPISDTAMFDSRNREERVSENPHSSSQSGVASFSASGYGRQVSKGMHYVEDPFETKRQQSQRETESSQFAEHYTVGKTPYHEAMNAYQRMNHPGLSNIPTSSQYQEIPKESGTYGIRQSQPSGPLSRNEGDLDGGERGYREADSAYSMLDPRQRPQGGQGMSTATNLDTAAAYAMMGIPGYPDPRMLGSRSHGQNYLGMYPWYNETALTQAIMESQSRPPLQGMMGSLSTYGSGSGFVDPRLRDPQGSRNMEEMETGAEYAREANYSQEVMNAMSRHKGYDSSGGSHRYRDQGMSLDQQYKDYGSVTSREAHFSHGAQGHGMLRDSHHEETAGRREQGYGGPGGSNSLGQGNSIHRSWM